MTEYSISERSYKYLNKYVQGNIRYALYIIHRSMITSKNKKINKQSIISAINFCYIDSFQRVNKAHEVLYNTQKLFISDEMRINIISQHVYSTKCNIFKNYLVNKNKDKNDIDFYSKCSDIISFCDILPLIINNDIFFNFINILY